MYRETHTHRSNQICIRFVWEICICRPTVKDHLSQLPLHIELLIPVVYLLELRSAYVTEARKKKGGKLNDALTGSLRYVSKSSVNIQPGRPFKPRPYYFSYINPIEMDDITC